MRFCAGRDGLGRPRHYDFPAGVAAFRSQVDYVIGGLDHFQMMLDQHRVPRVHQPVEARPDAVMGERSAQHRRKYAVIQFDLRTRRSRAACKRSVWFTGALAAMWDVPEIAP